MRRMYSDGQVVKVVNKAIDDGEIQAGGLTPEQEEKLDNSLQLPESAPAAQQLVGINTSKEQNALTISDGLVVDNGALKVVNDKRLILDFSKNQQVTLDAETAQKLRANYYEEVICRNVRFNDVCLQFIKRDLATALKWNNDSISSALGLGTNDIPYVLSNLIGIQSSTTGNIYGAISNCGYLSNITCLNYAWLKLVDTTLSFHFQGQDLFRVDPNFRQTINAGTTSGTTSVHSLNYGSNLSKGAFGDICLQYAPDANNSQKYIFFKCIYSDESSNAAINNFMVLKAELPDYDTGTITTYLMKWYPKTGAYTIKTI